MAVRNFWIEAQIDGRKTPLAGGPRSKDGGFHLSVLQRDNGHATTPLDVHGHVDEAGKLHLQVDRAPDADCVVIFEHVTDR